MAVCLRKEDGESATVLLERVIRSCDMDARLKEEAEFRDDDRHNITFSYFGREADRIYQELLTLLPSDQADNLCYFGRLMQLKGFHQHGVYLKYPHLTDK
ncbi:MAG: hypothetical protein LBS60_09065 [Deltaproteobacteria bacterium]|nr:hypothetical protein [Deltaproteobacteria bacterium]